MKTIIAALFITCMGYSTFAQKILQPYVKLKTGEVKEFEKVSIMSTNKIVGTDENGNKTQFAPKLLESVVVGKKETYNQDQHRQYVYLKLKSDKRFNVYGSKIEGSVIEGSTQYSVIISNGSNKIISFSGSRYYYSENNMKGSFLPSQSYYYVKGNRYNNIKEDDISKDEFIQELITDFGSCEGVATLVNEFKDKRAKYLRKFQLFNDLKELYLKSCLVL